jgi:hypothetical protein
MNNTNSLEMPGLIPKIAEFVIQCKDIDEKVQNGGNY